jgi:ubiquinone/menaquinone biosynthesis C-methylase UbiE
VRVAGEPTGRSLRRTEQYIGVDGLALLRLYGHDDASVADDILVELRALLDGLESGDGPHDVHGVQLDVVGGYARWAAVYDKPGNLLVAHEEPIVHAMLERLEGEPVLDVGCGTGRHMAWLSGHYRRTIGVDQSPQMLAKANAKVPGSDLRVGDVVDLPIETASVAGVICALTLEHLPDLDVAFREFVRVVVPGGWIVTSCLHPLVAQVLGWNPWFRDDNGRGDVERYLHSLSDYINAAVSVGLRVEECAEIPIELPGPPPDEVAIGFPIAHDGLPLILVMRFLKP